MRRMFAVALLGVALAGCSSSAAPAAPTPTGAPVKTGTPAAIPSSPATAAAHPTPVHINAGFASTIGTLCTAFARRDSATVTSALPYFQYNSGLRYGSLGDGEGQNGDPSLMATWLANSHVQCKLQSSGAYGHGTVLATGWSLPGGTALVELDTYSGRWKINDFTFGPYGALVRALHTAGPIARFKG